MQEKYIFEKASLERGVMAPPLGESGFSFLVVVKREAGGIGYQGLLLASRALAKIHRPSTFTWTKHVLGMLRPSELANVYNLPHNLLELTAGGAKGYGPIRKWQVWGGPEGRNDAGGTG